MEFGIWYELGVDRALGEVRLKVEKGEEEIVCRVSRDALEALVSRDGLGVRGLLSVAANYFELLADKWAQCIQCGRCEIDGSILLRREDMVPEKQRTAVSLLVLA